MHQETTGLLPRLWHQWPRVAVATLSVYYLFYSVHKIFRPAITPPDAGPKGSQYSYLPMYAFMLLKVAIGLQRVHVAVSKPSTEIAQFAFNVWLLGALSRGAFQVFVYSFVYFVPSLMERHNNATVQQNLTSNEVLQQSTRTTVTTPSLVDMLWMGIEPWVPSALDMLLGLALWTILNRRQQLDHEQEVRHEQGHHLLFGNGDLPTPVASASTVEGFKTEVELRQMRLRVPMWPRLVVGVWLLMRTIDGVRLLSRLSGGVHQAEWAIYFVQGVAGLYAIYSKILLHTQWLFYSICITTIHTAYRTIILHWNEDYTDIPFPPKNEHTGQQSTDEVAFLRTVKMVAFNAFYAYRLWAAWRLVADLKARDARVATAKRMQ